MKKFLTPSILLLSFLSYSIISFSQSQSPLEISLSYLKKNVGNYNLTESDIKDVAVSSNIYTRSNGMTNVYLVQRYEGIEIYNAIMNFTLSDDDKVVYAGNRFYANIDSRINTTNPAITPEKALQNIVASLGGPLVWVPQLKETRSAHSYVYDKGIISRNDIPVKLRYQPMPDGTLKLAWDVAIYYTPGSDYWSFRVDAVTGEILNKTSFTVHCRLHAGMFEGHEECKVNGIEFPELLSVKEASNIVEDLLMANQYNVYPFPVENPKQGSRVLLTNPADPIASPFGWHDTNGAAGAEYTITRGNNVHAYEDRNGDFSSMNNEPNGGDNLVFDFPIDLTKEPDQNINPSVVQLFYGVNFMHDFSYKFGFDEEANFQATNYTGNGQGGDYVRALDQYEGDNLGSLNNSTFTSPSDGSSGIMQMFLWDKSLAAGKNLKVNEPFSVAGTYNTAAADFGPQLTFNNPITGYAIIADDGSADNPSYACEPLANGNGADMDGKIVIIDRGGCDFDYKVLNAQENGAIAVIVCNFNENSNPMGSNLVGDQVTIPSVMVNKSDCDKIRVYAGAGGLNVTLQGQPSTTTGPQYIDGSLDNGLIAHEFAHGISNRLTGGPNSSDCLSSAEQMGEGWSDFIAMATTVSPFDNKNKKRGFANYVTNEDQFGKGLRQYPYSVDMSVNPHTYSDIINNSEVHYVGEVWAAMLWDLYWALVEKYGLDATYTNTNSGSYKAVKLVIDAMKIQPCDPGFEDGRDAILAADQLNYGGENECIIWDVFARRGLGKNAKQNDPYKTEDAVQNFDTKNECLNRLDIKKSSTPLINAGDEILYTIRVSNFKSVQSSSVIVTDHIAANTTYVSGSASQTPTIAGDMISFNLGNLNVNQEVTITYKVKSSSSISSTRKFYDDASSLSNWDIESINGTTTWAQVSNNFHSPSKSFGINTVPQENRHDLIFAKDIKVEGTRPVLRFYHNYNTEQGVDGGFVEISEDGSNFINAKTYFIRQGYTGKISYSTFVLPNVEGFSGNSNGWVASYIDLKDYVGKTIKKVRIRFGSDSSTGGGSWYVDDLEFMDMVNYNTEVCVTSNNGDMECATAPEEGTIVDSKTVATKDLVKGELKVYPNPATNYVTVSLNSSISGKHQLEITTLEGKLLQKEVVNLSQGENTHSIDVSTIPSGCYIIKIQNEKAYFVNKIVLHNK